MDFPRLKTLMEDEIPFNRVLGLRLTAATDKMVRLEIPFRPELVGDPLRPALHGGVLSAAADAAGGAAVWAGLGEDARISTIDLRVDYLRPARLETVVVEATVVRIGNRVGVVDVRLFHVGAESEAIATGKGVYNIKKARRPGD